MVTRTISEKVIHGIIVSSESSYIEKVKQAAIDPRFGMAPVGKVWGDSYWVSIWSVAFNSDRTGKLLSTVNQVTTTDNTVDLPPKNWTS
jgi:hypothetical protein